VERLAGFSPQNIWFTRSFYLAWSAMPPKLSPTVTESKAAILSQPVRELPPAAEIEAELDPGHAK
jgi:hypothetical protein